MTKAYHVVDARWMPGESLYSLHELVRRGDLSLAEACAQVTARWSAAGDPSLYVDQDEGLWIHLHAALEEAREYRDDFAPGARILEIDTECLEISQGHEYPHPTVWREIPGDRIRAIVL